MPLDIPLACTCGLVTGLVQGVTWSNARRLSCMCDDCQIYAHYLGRADEILDRHGGTDLSYATQSRVSLIRGVEQLRAVRLRETGVLRVYAACCRTPVAHVPAPKVAFVGIPHLFMPRVPGSASRDQALGPLVHRLQGRYARGELPEGAYPGTPPLLRLKALVSILWNTACGRYAPSPFHDGARAPIVTPAILSAAELERLRAHLPERDATFLERRLPGGCA